MSVASELSGKLRAILEARYGAAGPAERRQLFDAYDTNGDGDIDAAELKRILSDADVGNPHSRGYWVSGVLARMDRNKNGVICFDEFEAIVEGRADEG